MAQRNHVPDRVQEKMCWWTNDVCDTVGWQLRGVRVFLEGMICPCWSNRALSDRSLNEQTESLTKLYCEKLDDGRQSHLGGAIR